MACANPSRGKRSLRDVYPLKDLDSAFVSIRHSNPALTDSYLSKVMRLVCSKVGVRIV